jgi:hypothetical protein
MNAQSPFWRDGRQFPTLAQLDAAIADLAEHLSTDRYTLAEIAGLMGISRGSACALLRMLCEKMGEAVQ